MIPEIGASVFAYTQFAGRIVRRTGRSVWCMYFVVAVHDVNTKHDRKQRYEGIHVVRRLCTPPCGATARGVASSPPPVTSADAQTCIRHCATCDGPQLAFPAPRAAWKSLLQLSGGPEQVPGLDWELSRWLKRCDQRMAWLDDFIRIFKAQ